MRSNASAPKALSPVSSTPLRPLTPLQQGFIRHFAEGYSRTKAARLAGYGDPSHAQVDLMANPHVLRELALAAHQPCVEWRKLIERSKLALDYVLDPNNYDPQDGTEPKVQIRDVIRAAATVLQATARMQLDMLSDESSEDVPSASLHEAARRLVGIVGQG